MKYDHIKCGRTRRYLMDTCSTSLDTAGNFIDKAETAFAHDERGGDVEPSALERRNQALEAARRALGERNSLEVREALRVFWTS